MRLPFTYFEFAILHSKEVVVGFFSTETDVYSNRIIDEYIKENTFSEKSVNKEWHSVLTEC